MGEVHLLTPIRIWPLGPDMFLNKNHITSVLLFPSCILEPITQQRATSDLHRCGFTHAAGEGQNQALGFVLPDSPLLSFFLFHLLSGFPQLIKPPLACCLNQKGLKL